MASLHSALGDARFIFVVGKGGVGKSTVAAALALARADAGSRTHLISTDPAHSLSDVLGQSFGRAPAPSDCSGRLQVEEFDAEDRAIAWLEHATGPVSDILEAGTYLDAEDVAGFTRLALPGLDEMMAVLRLVQLAAEADGAVFVDTPPTGHALRLLDAWQTHETLAAALRAMADKAAIVASSLAGRSIRLAGESFIDELEDAAASYRSDVLASAAFVIAARPGALVVPETARLAAELERRRLRVAAHIWTGGMPDQPAAAASHFLVPVLQTVAGCDGLRGWLAALRPVTHSRPGEPAIAGIAVPSGTPPAPEQVAAAPATDGAALHPASTARTWIRAAPWRLIIVAGKGGVGKTTCAAAAAVELAGDRDVLLCSTDPAGSLDDVFGVPVTQQGWAAPHLRTRQVDAQKHLRRLRDQFRTDVEDALGGIGIVGSATLDRRVLEALWDLAPPGIEEFAALAALLGAAESGDTIILDTAPTGHFLRLLTLPDIALAWTRQLMRIVVKYQLSGAAGGIAESLLRTARELRALRDLLRSADSAAVLIVTLDEPVVTAETRRLRQYLDDAGIHVAATVLNRVHPDAVAATARTNPQAGMIIRAPLLDRPPVGNDALREFIGKWKIEG
jgi:arsenite/tail-anchored protein-transporting ATPase